MCGSASGESTTQQCWMPHLLPTPACPCPRPLFPFPTRTDFAHCLLSACPASAYPVIFLHKLQMGCRLLLLTGILTQLWRASYLLKTGRKKRIEEVQKQITIPINHVACQVTLIPAAPASCLHLSLSQLSFARRSFNFFARPCGGEVEAQRKRGTWRGLGATKILRVRDSSGL